MTETEEEVVERFSAWKRRMEKRELKVNMEKDRDDDTWKETNSAPRKWAVSRYCRCCGRVGANTVRCVGCDE